MSSAPRAPVIPKVEWNRLREPIERRYMGEKMSLQDLMEDMKRQYQFHATDKQYKRQLAQWGIRKNIPAEAMEVILNGSCNKARIVEIQSRYTVTNRKIQRFRHRQGQKIAPHGTITSDSASTSWEASTRNNPRIENITETSSNDNHIWHADEISDVQLSLPLDREPLFFVRIMFDETLTHIKQAMQMMLDTELRDWYWKEDSGEARMHPSSVPNLDTSRAASTDRSLPDEPPGYLRESPGFNRSGEYSRRSIAKDKGCGKVRLHNLAFPFRNE
ncbi:Clr5 domain-containing protein [Exophiala viscosa]|uniref:Clr5 domain-containing protein n=1 Tax=Exophiala viscosa TaxID=2486360 RepID=UPI0021969EC3|nr:Clr5 domain-containing protein [Exophiala viscosa]